MKKINIITLLSLLFFATWCYADSLSIESGDMLTCDIQNNYYGLDTPYQKLFFIKNYITDIVKLTDQSNQYTITTINNDSFTGHLINSQIVALMGTGLKKDFPADSIRNIHLDTSETKENDPIKTAMKKTTIFEMKNGDYFSGQMTTSRLNINTGKMTLPIDRRNLFRIVFTNPGTKSVEVHLSNGSVQTGVISEDMINITPYSTSPINIRTSQFKSMQFHTFEYIKKKITPAEYSDHEFCLFKCNSGFMSECCHYQTTSVLLRDPDGHVGEIVVQTEGGLQVLSEAGQAVVVRDIKEPPPLPTLFDEQQIQAIFGKALGAEPPAPEKFILYFNVNSTHLLLESEAMIPEIIKCIQERKSFDIHINGYSDRTGTYKYNLALSLKRADYIQQQLVNAGIENRYIATTATGEANPLVPTVDGVAEPRNRRVEVIVR